MRLRHIEVFHAIYLSGSINAAAKALNVSQPSLSKTLQHAEDQLGFKLFRRVRGRLIPTDEAHVVFRESSEVYAKIETLQQACKSLKNGDAGHIRLSVLPVAGLAAAPAAIARFRAGHPDVSFDIQTYHHDEALRALFDRTSEVAFVFDEGEHPRLKTLKLGQGELVLLYRRGEFANVGERIPLSAIIGRDFVGITSSGPLGDILSAELAKLKAEVREVVSAHTFYVAAGLVREGVGVAIVDELTARAMRDERLEFKRLEPAVKFDICAIHLEDRPPSHLAAKFITEMQKSFERILAA
ncbi:MAG TPA: LysR family transcriptional regulator [Vitreimonas sp.]|uniref:LysR family transcriptional regulator n=1 Tax=Vitreimonas sp. TaxID=3069702 RepID=UPI002D2A5CFB|nr:LysR family transcriptional regulator [Vitreimonas sp.]HYD88016.1 LysR family transcriptional regulator [Vitreimonas sp.]